MAAGKAANSPVGHDSHGQTPAAWTAVTIVIIAFLVGTIGMVIGVWALFWIGCGLVVLGGIVGKVMQAMGLGKQPRSGHPRSDH